MNHPELIARLYERDPSRDWEGIVALIDDAGLTILRSALVDDPLPPAAVRELEDANVRRAHDLRAGLDLALRKVREAYSAIAEAEMAGVLAFRQEALTRLTPTTECLIGTITRDDRIPR